VAGRFAPSPTGPLHLGNLRTALLAWLAARSTGRRFVVRMEDLDPVTASPEHERAQLADLAALGLDWDGDVVRQSKRTAVYRAALADLTARGLTYECYCSRREIREAAAAPHGDELVYPGTCRDLSATDRARRGERRAPALRFRADAAPIEVVDQLAGRYEGRPTDVVLQRNDGTPAYNLAVVVDDGAQGVDQVVRGDDLLSSTPTQVALQGELGLPTPTYLHVPLVVGPGGARLAKRDGAVTVADLAGRGASIDDVRGALLTSIGALAEPGPAGPDALAAAVETFDVSVLARLGRRPVAVATLGLPC
jgi:glutamyl-tRNA synthetase